MKNTSVNVYGADIVTTSTARVHPAYFVNADLVPVGRHPLDQANWLGLWSCLLDATVHIHCRHLLLLQTQKADTVPLLKKKLQF